MNAIILEKFGSVENLKIKKTPLPKISEDEVLVKTKAFSINPVDVKTRQGKALAKILDINNPIILGWDISGIVVDKGKKVDKFQLNDAVFGMVNFVGWGKVYAEYVAVPANQIVKKPDNIKHTEAAASTLTALTAWQAFTHYGTLKNKDKVLIHAAAGGVGHFAVQIAKYLDAYVIGTSSKKIKIFY